MANKTPTYLTSPLTKHTGEKKVRTMPVSTIVRLARSMTLSGEYDVSAEARGLPVRPARNKDGSAMLSVTGERVDKVVKDIRDFATTMLDHIESGWIAFDDQVKAAKPKEYAAAMAEEQASIVHLVTSDIQAVADAKTARAQALAAEKAKAAILAQAEAAADNAPAQTPVAA